MVEPPRLLLQADGWSDNAVQQYSASVSKLAAAVESFKARQPEISLVLNLGDSIDGNATHELTQQDLEAVAHEFSRLVRPPAYLVLFL